MNPVLQAWLVFALVGVFAGVLTDLTIQMIRAAINKTRPLAVLPDEEGGIGFLGRAKMDKGHIVIGKGENKKRYPVKSESRQVMNSGIAYIIGRQTGANLAVPSKDEIIGTLKGSEKVAFEICDPLLLAKVFDKRQFQETVEGQQDGPDWKAQAIIPVAILGGLAIIGLIILAATMAG